MADSPVKMETHGAPQPAHDTPGSVPWQRPARRVKPEPSASSPGADAFRLGVRYRLSTTADGREVVEQIPLRAEDLMYPQEGDAVSDGYPHNTGLHPRADSLRRHLEKRGATMVTSNVTLVLRSDGRNCAPDIAVIAGEIDRSKIKRTVDLRTAGGRLIFALEVVSTSEKEIEDKDVKLNVKRYAREKVPDYFTVYPIVESKVKNLVGRRLKKGDYDEVAPDARGRVYSKELDLFFEIDAVTEELVAIDAKTGQRLLISDEEEAGRKRAEAALEQEAEARCRAEKRAEQEAEVRRQEAAARRQAEERVEQAEERVEQAEERVEQEAEVRRAKAEEQGLRRGVKVLCTVLGLAWGGERNAQVEHMSASQLEVLRAHLVREKSWPESFPETSPC